MKATEDGVAHELVDNQEQKVTASIHEEVPKS